NCWLHLMHRAQRISPRNSHRSSSRCWNLFGRNIPSKLPITSCVVSIHTRRWLWLPQINSSTAIRFPVHCTECFWNVRTRCRSEEHTSELQSRFDLVCRLLLEKKNNNKKYDFKDQVND